MATETKESESSTVMVPWDEAESGRGLAAIEPTAELVAQAYDAIINKTLPPELGDPEITRRLILERIRQGTFEQSMSPVEQLPAWAETFPETPVAVMGFHLNPSSIEDSEGERGVYAVVELADPRTGEMTVVHTGGDNVLVQLVKAWEEGAYPFVAVLTVRKTSTPGRKTYWLKSPEGS